MAAAIGIDLGTTNSCLAVCRDGKPEVIPAPDGGRTTPSVISYGDDGERLIGRSARRQSILHPQQTVQSIKRLIGRRADELEQDGIVGQALVIEESPEGAARVIVGGRSRSPEEISAVILRQLRADAERWLGETVSDAVITVPAYFNDAQRQATKDAGAIAGLNVLRIINEPTAAALAYGLGDSEREQTVLVFDLGGGTLDVSILTIADDVFDVMATAGDNALGGDDFDRAIADWIFTEIASDGVLLPDDQGQLRARIFEAAERAKCDLSSAVETTISLPFLLARDNEPYHLERPLSRAKLEGLVEPLMERAILPLRQALSDAQIEISDLDQVLLVGGMTRMPLVQSRVAEITGREPAQSVNPDEVVALGAAIQADILGGGSGHDLLLVDVTPLTLGIETRGGLVAPLIPRNNAIPARHAEVFTTAEDAQPSVEVHVVQGERPMANDCRSLGRLNLYGIPPQPRGIPQIQVAFEIDQNGILQVTARDLVSGQASALRIEGSSGLSTDELSTLIAEAENEADGDRLRRRRAESKNNAEALIYQAERALDAAPDVDAAIRESLAEEILAMRELIDDEDFTEEALYNRGESLIQAAALLAQNDPQRFATADDVAAGAAGEQGESAAPEVIIVEADEIIIEGEAHT